MVAIVSGNSLGLSNTSAAVLGQNGLIGQADLGANNEEAIVNVSNGNLVLQSDDDFLAGLGLDINSVLTYNSQGNTNEGNGYGWSMGMISLVNGLTGTANTVGSTITRTDGDGSQVVYTYNGTDYVGHEGSGADDTLSINARTGVWTWTDGSTGDTETYGANGYITSSADLDGNKLTYTYTAGLLTKIADANGDSTTYVYNANGNLSQINDDVSGTTTTRVYYSYNTQNQLVNVTTDLNPSESSISNNSNIYWTNYGYNSTGQIDSVSQKDGATLNINYVQVNGQEYVQSVSDAFGNTTTYNYDGNQTTVTDPQDNVTTYSYDDQGRLTNVATPAVNGIVQNTSYAYDVNGDLTSSTDALGNQTQYSYDGNGNLLEEVDAAGDTTTYTYNSSNLMTSSTVYTVPASGTGIPASDPETTYYVYNTHNELAFEISAAGRVTQNTYNSGGDLTASVSYGGNLYSYDAPGGPSAPLSPTNLPTLAQMTAWSTSSAINLTQTNPTHYTYNTRGQLASVINYTSVSSTGALSGGKTTQYTYNAEGQLVQTIDGDGNLTSYTYDGLGRQLSVTDANLNTTTTVYNDTSLGTIVTQTLASGLATTSSYNADGELISVVESNANANNSVLSQTTYAYDSDGNLLMVTNPDGESTNYLYDADGRQIATITPDGELTETCYNADNQVSAIIQYTNPVDTSILTLFPGYPVNPPISSLINPEGGSPNPVYSTSLNVYDNAGRLVYTVDAAGYVTQTNYDGVSNAVSTTAYANALTSTQLQALGTSPTAAAVAADIVAAPGAGDRTTETFYDSDNLVIGTLNADGYLTQYVRNGAGQITQTIAYANAPEVSGAALATDSFSTLLAAIPPSSSDIVETNFYNAEGLLAYELDGDGYLTAYTYDGAGNLTKETRYAMQVTVNGVAAVGDAQIGVSYSSLVWTTNSEDHTTKYTYTALNQVATETDPGGVTTAYAYDNVGNLVSTTVSTSATDVNARTTDMKYNLQGQLIAELSGNAVAQLTTSNSAQIWATQATTYTYDAVGDRTSMTDADGNRTLYYYDADNRLIYTIDAMGDVQGQTYTNLGQVYQTTTYANTISAIDLATMTGGALTANALAILDALPNPAVDSTQTYTYDVRGELTSTTDALGYTVTNEYDAFGDIVTKLTQVDSQGDELEQDYTYDNLGQVTGTSSYDNESNAVGGDSITAPTSMVETTSTRYDAFGRVIEYTDANGNNTNMTYDQLGREVSVTDPASGAIEHTTYDAFDRILNQVDFNGNTTTTVYDTATRTMTISVSATTPQGTTQTLTQKIVDNEFGQQASVTDGNGNVTTYTYDLDGNLTIVSDSLGVSQTDAYDAANNLISSTDANGVITSYTYDAANRVLMKTVDPVTTINPKGLNLETQYSYNSSGQVLTVTDPLGIITQTQYDQKGEVTSVTVDPNGLALQTSYQYNGIGQTLQVTDPNGNTTVYQYNSLGQRVSQTVAAGDLNLTTSYTYDSNNNLISVTDPDGNVTSYVYDADNRVVYKIDGAGDVTHTVYDADGNVIQTTTYANQLNSSELIGVVAATSNGVPLSAAEFDSSGPFAISPDASRDNTINNVYDSDNRLIYTVDGTGAVTQYTYDGNGNVTQQTSFATTIRTNTLLTLGSIASAITTSAADRTTINVYDARNRVIDTATAQGMVDGVEQWAVVKNTYDADGNLVSRTAYATPLSGSTQSSYATVAKWVNSVSAATGQDQTTRMVYDNAGRLIYTATAQGKVAGSLQWSIVQNTYDADGNVIARTAYGTTLSSSTLASNPTPSDLVTWITAFTDNETAVQASLDRQTLMVYDNGGRLIYTATAQNETNGVLQWAVVQNSYDSNGNLIQTTAYDTFLSSATQGGQTIAQWIESVPSDPAADRTTLMEYDGANRLIQTQTSQSVDANNNIQWATVDYTLDGDGNIIVRTAFALGDSFSGVFNPGSPYIAPQDRVTVMSYDADNRLIATATLQNATNAGYDFNSYTLAVVTQTYDGNGNVISQTAYSNLLTRYGITGYPINVGNITQWAQQNANPQYDRTTNNVYDADGRLIYSVDPMGFVTQNTYDAVGNLTQTELYSAPVQINGPVNAESVAAAIQVAKATPQDNPAYQEPNRITSFTYDATGNVLSSVDAIGGLDFYTYDAFGNKLTYTNAMGNRWTYAYDAAGQMIEESDPDTLVVTSVTAALATKTAMESLTTLTAYDAFGDAQTVTTEGLPSSGAATNQRQITYGYDLAGHQISITDPSVSVLSTNPQLVSQVASGLLTATSVSAVDSLLDSSATPPASNPTTTVMPTTTVTYDALGNAIESADAEGNVSYKFYNNAGEVTYAVDANGYVTGYTYDAFGDVLTTTRYANGVVMPTSALAASPQALEVSELYATILGCAPTPSAWAYWTAQLINGAPMSDIAQQFVNYAESVGTLSGNMSGMAFVSQMFQNALGRNPTYAEQNNWSWVEDISSSSWGIAAADFIAGIVSEGATTTDGAYFSGLVASNLAQSVNTPVNANLIQAMLSPSSSDRTITTEYDLTGRVADVIDPQVYVYDLASGSTSTLSGIWASQITTTTYDAFGDSILTQEFGGEANGYGGFTVLTDERSEYSYFNQDGEATAQINATSDLGAYGTTPEGYLTTMSYDAAGNMVEQYDYADEISDDPLLNPSPYNPDEALGGGTWDAALQGTTATPYTAPAPTVNDRETTYTYDGDNRKTSQTLVNANLNVPDDLTTANLSSPTPNITTTYGYDLVGDLVSTTDALGDVEYTFYDALGQVTATAIAAGSPSTDGTPQVEMQTFALDIYGDVVQQVAYADSASITSAPGGANPGSYSPETSSNDRITTNVFNADGKVTESINAAGNATYTDYNADGEVALQWQLVTTTSYVSTPPPTVSTTSPQNFNTSEQKAPTVTTSTEVEFTLTNYDSVGQVASVITPGAKSSAGSQQDNGKLTAALTTTANTYDAFGEVLTQSVDGVQTTSNEYDDAGRVWNSTVDGVTTATLYNIEGQVTAVVNSTASAYGGQSYLQDAFQTEDQIGTLVADNALSYNSNYIISNTIYDLQGNAIEHLAPDQQTGTTAASSVATLTATAVIANSSDEGNTVYIGLPSAIASLGSGDLMVQLDYTAAGSSTAESTTQTFSADQLQTANSNSGPNQLAAAGLGSMLTMNWTANPESTIPAVGSVTGIQVWKKDISGQWQQLIDTNPPVNASGALTSTSGPVLEPAGTTYLLVPDPENALTPVSVTFTEQNLSPPVGYLMNFGNMILVNTSFLSNGDDTYTVSYGNSDGTTTTQDTGVLNLSAPLNTVNNIPEEYQQISQLYWAILNRAPYETELNSWVTAMNAGASLVSVAQSIISYGESNNIIGSGYQLIPQVLNNLLGQNAISSLTASYQLQSLTEAYTNQVSAAGTPDNSAQIVLEIINQFANYSGGNAQVAAASQTFDANVQLAEDSPSLALAAASTPLQLAQTQVAQLYIAICGCAPDGSELNNLVGTLTANPPTATLGDIATELLSYPPVNTASNYNWSNIGGATQFVTRAFQNVFGVAPNPAQLAQFTTDYNDNGAGQTMVDIVNALQTSTVHTEITQMALFNNQVAVALTYALDTNETNQNVAIDVIRDATATGVSQSLSDILSDPAESSDNFTTDAALAAAAAASADQTAATAAAADSDAALSVQLSQLTTAILDRPPQTYEMWYSVELLEQNPGPAGLLAMATSIFSTQETLLYYPTTFTAEQFVKQFYQIALGRLPTAQELAYGEEQLASNPQDPGTRAAYVLNIIGDIESGQAVPGANALTEPTELTDLETQYLFNDRVQQDLQTIETGAENTGLLSNTAVSGQPIYAAPTTYMTYDRYGNELSVSNPDNPNDITYSSYNVFNEVTATYAPFAVPGITANAPDVFVPANDPTTSPWLSTTTSDTTYDVLGRAIATEDANGNITQMEYDGLGNLEETVDPDGGIILYTNDAFGDRTSMEQLDPTGTTSANGSTDYNYTVLSDTTYLFDMMGHEIESESAGVTLGDVSRTNVVPGTEGSSNGANQGPAKPDNFSSQVTLSPTLEQEINLYGYNELGELTVSLTTSGSDSSAEPDGISTTEFTYLQNDDMSKLMSVLSTQLKAQNKSTLATDNTAVSDITTINYTQYDLAGNVTDTVDGDGDQTQYGYDALHNKIIEVDADGNTQSWVMNSGGSSLVATWHEMGGDDTMYYTYNQDGQLTLQSLIVAAAAGVPVHTDYINYTYTGTLLASVSTFNPATDNDTVDTADPDITTDYSYDLAGNQIAVVTTSDAGQPGNEQVIQDNHETYDPLNRVSSIEDSRYDVQYKYDANGNVIDMTTTYLDAPSDTATSSTELTTAQANNQYVYNVTDYNVYDSMNRAILVDGTGVDTPGAATVNGIDTSEISSTQGHILTYNTAGQRTSDTYYGTTQSTADSAPTVDSVASTETYAYDAAGELVQISRDGNVIDNLDYDAAGAVVASGATNLADTDTGVNIVSYTGSLADVNDGGAAPAPVGSPVAAAGLDMNLSSVGTIQSYDLNYTSETNFFDLAGRLQTQTVWQGTTNGTPSTTDDVDIAYAYDGVGNTLDIATHQHPSAETDDTTLLINSWVAGATYEQAYEVSELFYGSNLNEGANGTTYTYDDFGNLLSTKELQSIAGWNATELAGGTETDLVDYVTTIDGEIGQSTSYATPGGFGMVTNTLLANGQSLGSSVPYGENTVGTAVNYTVLSATVDSNQPSNYTVATGDTWNSIAYSLWGNASMGWAIQEANGGSANVPSPGTLIIVPPEPSTVQNNSQTYTPYNISAAIGNTTPATPTPVQTPGNPGCGVIGEVIEVIIVAVVAYYTGGAAANALEGLLGPEGSVIAGGAIGGAAGDLAGQVAGDAMGLQTGINWKQVELGAVGGAVTAGIGELAGPPGATNAFTSYFNSQVVGAAAQAAVSNAITQGIGVETGIQPHFEWSEVAMAAIPAGMDAALNIPDQTTNFGQNLAKGLVQFATGSAIESVEGGQGSYASIAAQALGGALGGQAVGQLQANAAQQVLAKAQAQAQAAQVSSDKTAFLQSEIQNINETGWGTDGGNTMPQINTPSTNVASGNVTSGRLMPGRFYMTPDSPGAVAGYTGSEWDPFGGVNPVPMPTQDLTTLTPDEAPPQADPSDVAMLAAAGVAPSTSLAKDMLEGIQVVEVVGNPSTVSEWDAPGPVNTPPTLSLNDPNFIQAALPIIANKGVANFSTGGVRVLVFPGNVSLVPVIRQPGQTFTDAALAASSAHGLNAVVNGELYEAPRSALLFGAGGGAADPTDIVTQGEVLQNGNIVTGRSSPQTFYIAQSVGSDSQLQYSFGFGDPPASSTVAFGGGKPLIIGGLEYGAVNLYAPGSNDGPTTGDPGDASDTLIQKSNAGIAALESKSDSTGKVVLAYSASNNVLAVVVQADGVDNGVSIDSIRNNLFNAGFNNALAFDGSSSATLVLNQQVQVTPATYKNGTIGVGIGIKLPGN